MTPISPARRSSARRRGWLRRTPKRTSPAVPRESLDRFPAHRAADRGTRRGDAQGDEPAARQGGRPHARRQFPRDLGVHGRKSRGQRGDGRRAAGIFPGHPGARRIEHHVAARQHHLDDLSQRGQRPGPPRDRHELRHRRARPLQPRQYDHRPRLQPAVAEPPGRIGAGRNLYGRARQPLAYSLASPRTRSAARGSRSTCRRASSRPTAP